MIHYLVNLGHTVKVEWIDRSGVARNYVPSTDAALAWIGPPKTGALLVVPLPDTLKKGPPASGVVADMHAKFHHVRAANIPQWEIELPDLDEWTPLGLVRAVTYYPPEILGSAKGGSDWRHTFGDSGQGERGREEDRPYWAKNGRCFAMIRRAKNKFSLDEWIRA